MIKNKRLDERVELRGLQAAISDGNRVFDGYVEDVSFSGFKITQLPKEFKVEARQYVTVVSGYRKNFKIVIQPRWNKKTNKGLSQEVGFMIANPPWVWTEFIQDILPEEEPEDIQSNHD